MSDTSSNKGDYQNIETYGSLQKRIADLEAQNAVLRELYERHKHLDMFLSDEKFPPIGRTGSAILYELWEFIKQAAIDGGAMGEGE